MSKRSPIQQAIAQLTADERFFYDNAGYSYQPSRESAEEGRISCAKRYAEAEAQARFEGISFHWETDSVDSSDFYTSRNHKPYELWVCVCRNEHGTAIGSVGGVDFGRNGTPWSDKCRRVVEAELAIEAL